jgi:phosphate uptake regulator
MEKRKIQLIAGSTYSITLPKQWIINQGLHAGKELFIKQYSNELHLTAIENEIKSTKEIIIPLEKYSHIISNILFSSYYIGADKIIITSKKEIDRTIKRKIRKALHFMSGTEINKETHNTVEVIVYLDKKKVDVCSLLKRMCLILQFNTEELVGENNIEDVELNEQEIDRLYHLIHRITTLAMRDVEILKSSCIGNIMFIPSILKLASRMESIGDYQYRLSKILIKKDIKDINNLELIHSNTKNMIHTITNSEDKIPIISEDRKAIKNWIDNIKDDNIREMIGRINRNAIVLNEEAINLLYYKQYISDYQEDNLSK